MDLRQLEIDDATMMLEWMHDEEIVRNLQADFLSKNLQDCESFIENCDKYSDSIHLAIADDSNEYMGTVSLKNIDKDNKSAEFAIVLRRKAIGKGYSQYAMKNIIKKGFEELGLNKIYWCVSKKNKRAISFYDKNGYKKTDSSELDIKGYEKEKIKEYLWYCENKLR